MVLSLFGIFSRGLRRTVIWKDGDFVRCDMLLLVQLMV